MYKSFIPCPALETLDEIIENYQLLNKDLKIYEQSITNEEILLAIPQEQLRQVLIIILDNAIKYSGDNKEIIICSNVVNDKCNIKIQDNGYGISGEDLPYIFDRFYRVDKARNRENGGSGLGLAIAKEIIEVFKGTIRVESELGKGTVISLIIPYDPS